LTVGENKLILCIPQRRSFEINEYNPSDIGIEESLFIPFQSAISIRAVRRERETNFYDCETNS